MTILLYILGALITLACLVILVVSNLPSPTLTQLARRYLGPRKRP